MYVPIQLINVYKQYLAVHLATNYIKILVFMPWYEVICAEILQLITVGMQMSTLEQTN